MRWSRVAWVGLVVLAACGAGAQTPEDWFDVGLTQAGEGKLADAEASLTEAVKADPRFKAGWQALAEVLEMRGKTARAALCRQQAEQAPATREGEPPPLTAAQRLALIDRGGDAAPAEPPAGGQPQAQPNGQPPVTPQPTTNVPPQPGVQQQAGNQPPTQPGGPGQSAPGVGLQPLPKLSNRDDKGNLKPLQLLSQHGAAEYCDILQAPDGKLHAIWIESPGGWGNPACVYHRYSLDGGQKWTLPETLSDDESGRSAAGCRLVLDASGRVYAIWKYVPVRTIDEGPGGNTTGDLVVRCFDGGVWSSRATINAQNEPVASWYTASDPSAALYLVYSQIPAETYDNGRGGVSWYYANRIAARRLDGAVPGPVRIFLEPPPLPTEQQIQAARDAGKPYGYQDLMPKQDGLRCLRGLFNTQGEPWFIGDHNDVPAQGDQPARGMQFRLWDGTGFQVLHQFEVNQTCLTYQNPAELMADSAGRWHVIRQPEKGEIQRVRDYPLVGNTLGEPQSVISCQNGRGVIRNFQAESLPGGRMVVCATLDDKPEPMNFDGELFLSFSDGGGQWTDPFCVTDNATRMKLAASNPTFTSRHARVTIDGTGHPCVLFVAEQNPQKPANHHDNVAVYFLRL